MDGSSSNNPMNNTQPSLTNELWSLHPYHNRGGPIIVNGRTHWDVSVGIGDMLLGTFSGASPAPSGYPCLDNRAAVMAAAQRAVDCVNACRGVDDPFVLSKAFELLQIMTKKLHEANELLQAHHASPPMKHPTPHPALRLVSGSFTPGPWKADGYHVRQSGLHGTRMIADICYTGPHHTPPEEYPKSCQIADEANARLIAAAPEMLEALQNLTNDDGGIPAHVWGLCQAAISKAGSSANATAQTPPESGTKNHQPMKTPKTPATEGETPLASQGQNTSAIAGAMRVLGMDGDAIFQRIRDDLNRGLANDQAQ